MTGSLTLLQVRLPLLLLFALAELPAQPIPWDFAALSKTPRVTEAKSAEPGVRAILYDSVPWHGKPTRVFAYYGVPTPGSAKRVPAMVLIHGGGGTAFAEWVRLWNHRGYAAIAMDTCGNEPDAADPSKPWAPVKKHHEWGGPEGWGGFAQIDEPPSDQWTYHAVAAAVLAHSLLRSFPEVDPKRIGVTGISWGGYLTDIVAGVDRRFRFASPVYGCGFLGEDSAWLKNFAEMGPDRAKRWLALWDPSQYLPLSRIPMLWVTGTNDFAYPMGSLQKSYRLPKGDRSLAVRVRMPHNHADGAKPEEIHAYADAIFLHRATLPRIIAVTRHEKTFSVRYRSRRTVVKAELNYTNGKGRWQERKWESVPASVDAIRRTATVEVPSGATAFFVNLYDDRGLVASTEHEDR